MIDQNICISNSALGGDFVFNVICHRGWLGMALSEVSAGGLHGMKWKYQNTFSIQRRTEIEILRVCWARLAQPASNFVPQEDAECSLYLGVEIYIDEHPVVAISCRPDTAVAAAITSRGREGGMVQMVTLSFSREGGHGEPY